MSRTAKGVQELTRKKEYNVIAQLVCTRRGGWKSSVGLPAVATTATTKRGAIIKAAAPVASQGLA